MSRRSRKKSQRRLNPPLPQGITPELMSSFKKCSDIYGPEETEQIKLCMFYSRLSERLREQGYSYENGYKISLHNCEGGSLPGDVRTLPPPVFHIEKKPPGIWFSDFYEIDSSSGEPRVLKRPNTSKSWTEWCIDEGMDWINPNKCTHILIAKMKEVEITVLNPTKSDILRIDSKAGYDMINERFGRRSA